MEGGWTVFECESQTRKFRALFLVRGKGNLAPLWLIQLGVLVT